MTQNIASGIVAAVLADQANILTQQASLTLPADGEVLSGVFGLIVKAVQEGQTGTGAYTPQRLPNVLKAFNAQAVTISSGNTPTSIWTPAAGKKFRLMGYSFSSSAAVGIIFHDLASVGGGGLIPMPSPVLAALALYTTPAVGNGYLSTAANNQLWIDATAASTLTGFVFGIEE